MRYGFRSKGETQAWTLAELRGELRRFGDELERAGLKPLSIATYVGRSDTFLRWLGGEYTPRGPNAE